MNGMNPTIIIQARIQSTRLPKKVLLPIVGKPILQHVIERCRQSGYPVCIATADDCDEILKICETTLTPAYVGQEGDVLDRYYQASLKWQADPIIRITADCPLVDPDLIRRLVDIYAAKCRYDRYYLVSVATGEGAGHLGLKRFADGLDAECIDWCALGMAWLYATGPDREHVTPWIWRNFPDRVYRLENDRDEGETKLSIDTIEDFVRVKELLTGKRTE